MKLRLAIFGFAFLFVFSTVASTEAIAQSESAESRANDDTPGKQRTRQLIKQYFPELDRNSVDGWVDSYSAMSEQELVRLLQQRKLLGGSDNGLSKFKLDLPMFDLERNSTTKPKPGAPFTEAQVVISRNLRGLNVIGHRGQKFCFEYSGAADGNLSSLAIQTVWNLSPGKSQFTGRPLDLSIRAPQRTMFRLEPGCVLTRSGRFSRFDDGRVGQVIDGKQLTLFPEVRVSKSSDAAELGRLDFGGVLIKNESLLKSSNGVFFMVADENRTEAFAEVKKLTVTSGTLELSNVDLAVQRDLQETLDVMQQHSLQTR